VHLDGVYWIRVFGLSNPNPNNCPAGDTCAQIKDGLEGSNPLKKWILTWSETIPTRLLDRPDLGGAQAAQPSRASKSLGLKKNN